MEALRSKSVEPSNSNNSKTIPSLLDEFRASLTSTAQPPVFVTRAQKRKPIDISLDTTGESLSSSINESGNTSSFKPVKFNTAKRKKTFLSFTLGNISSMSSDSIQGETSTNSTLVSSSPSLKPTFKRPALQRISVKLDGVDETAGNSLPEVDDKSLSNSLDDTNTSQKSKPKRWTSKKIELDLTLGPLEEASSSTEGSQLLNCSGNSEPDANPNLEEEDEDPNISMKHDQNSKDSGSSSSIIIIDTPETNDSINNSLHGEKNNGSSGSQVSLLKISSRDESISVINAPEIAEKNQLVENDSPLNIQSCHVLNQPTGIADEHKNTSLNNGHQIQSSSMVNNSPHSLKSSSIQNESLVVCSGPRQSSKPRESSNKKKSSSSQSSSRVSHFFNESAEETTSLKLKPQFDMNRKSINFTLSEVSNKSEDNFLLNDTQTRPKLIQKPCANRISVLLDIDENSDSSIDNEKVVPENAELCCENPPDNVRHDKCVPNDEHSLEQGPQFNVDRKSINFTLSESNNKSEDDANESCNATEDTGNSTEKVSSENPSDHVTSHNCVPSVISPSKQDIPTVIEGGSEKRISDDFVLRLDHQTVSNDEMSYRQDSPLTEAISISVPDESMEIDQIEVNDTTAKKSIPSDCQLSNVASNEERSVSFEHGPQFHVDRKPINFTLSEDSHKSEDNVLLDDTDARPTLFKTPRANRISVRFDANENSEAAVDAENSTEKVSSETAALYNKNPCDRATPDNCVPNGISPSKHDIPTVIEDGSQKRISDDFVLQLDETTSDQTVSNDEMSNGQDSSLTEAISISVPDKSIEVDQIQVNDTTLKKLIPITLQASNVEINKERSASPVQRPQFNVNCKSINFTLGNISKNSENNFQVSDANIETRPRLFKKIPSKRISVQLGAGGNGDMVDDSGVSTENASSGSAMLCSKTRPDRVSIDNCVPNELSSDEHDIYTETKDASEKTISDSFDLQLEEMVSNQTVLNDEMSHRNDSISLSEAISISVPDILMDVDQSEGNETMHDASKIRFHGDSSLDDGLCISDNPNISKSQLITELSVPNNATLTTQNRESRQIQDDPSLTAWTVSDHPEAANNENTGNEDPNVCLQSPSLAKGPVFNNDGPNLSKSHPINEHTEPDNGTFVLENRGASKIRGDSSLTTSNSVCDNSKDDNIRNVENEAVQENPKESYVRLHSSSLAHGLVANKDEPNLSKRQLITKQSESNNGTFIMENRKNTKIQGDSSLTKFNSVSATPKKDNNRNVENGTASEESNICQLRASLSKDPIPNKDDPNMSKSQLITKLSEPNNATFTIQNRELSKMLDDPSLRAATGVSDHPGAANNENTGNEMALEESNVRLQSTSLAKDPEFNKDEPNVSKSQLITTQKEPNNETFILENRKDTKIQGDSSITVSNSVSASLIEDNNRNVDNDTAPNESNICLQRPSLPKDPIPNKDDPNMSKSQVITKLSEPNNATFVLENRGANKIQGSSSITTSNSVSATHKEDNNHNVNNDTAPKESNICLQRPSLPKRPNEDDPNVSKNQVITKLSEPNNDTLSIQNRESSHMKEPSLTVVTTVSDHPEPANNQNTDEDPNVCLQSPSLAQDPVLNKDGPNLSKSQLITKLSEPNNGTFMMENGEASKIQNDPSLRVSIPASEPHEGDNDHNVDKNIENVPTSLDLRLKEPLLNSASKREARHIERSKNISDVLADQLSLKVRGAVTNNSAEGINVVAHPVASGSVDINWASLPLRDCQPVDRLPEILADDLIIVPCPSPFGPPITPPRIDEGVSDYYGVNAEKRSGVNREDGIEEVALLLQDVEENIGVHVKRKSSVGGSKRKKVCFKPSPENTYHAAPQHQTESPRPIDLQEKRTNDLSQMQTSSEMSEIDASIRVTRSKKHVSSTPLAQSKKRRSGIIEIGPVSENKASLAQSTVLTESQFLKPLLPKRKTNLKRVGGSTKDENSLVDISGNDSLNLSDIPKERVGPQWKGVLHSTPISRHKTTLEREAVQKEPLESSQLFENNKAVQTAQKSSSNRLSSGESVESVSRINEASSSQSSSRRNGKSKTSKLESSSSHTPASEVLNNGETSSRYNLRDRSSSRSASQKSVFTSYNSHRNPNPKSTSLNTSDASEVSGLSEVPANSVTSLRGINNSSASLRFERTGLQKNEILSLQSSFAASSSASGLFDDSDSDESLAVSHNPSFYSKPPRTTRVDSQELLMAFHPPPKKPKLSDISGAKRQTFHKPGKWANAKLYKWLEDKLKVEYRDVARKESEFVIIELNRSYALAVHGHPDPLEGIKQCLSQRRICENNLDFYSFLNRFMPMDFKVAAIPMCGAFGGIVGSRIEQYDPI